MPSLNIEIVANNLLNNSTLSLHKLIRMAIFASRTNVYRWFTDTFLSEFINRFALAIKVTIVQLVAWKSVAFLCRRERQIVVLNVVGSSPTSHPTAKRDFSDDFPLF